MQDTKKSSVLCIDFQCFRATYYANNFNLTEHYAPLLKGTYGCIDRIVLNAYIPMLMVPGGVRNWYRIMQGSDTDMSDSTMMRFAGRFSRRVQSFCKKKEIPAIASVVNSQWIDNEKENILEIDRLFLKVQEKTG